MKHLIVTGNILCFMDKAAIQTFPLDRYVLRRGTNSQPIEIITKEEVHRSLLPEEFRERVFPNKDVNSPGDDGPKFGTTGENEDKAIVYTWAKLEDGIWKWHQECDAREIPGTDGRAPLETSPWLPLRFNAADGEDYGRGRVEEFIGDLNTLDSEMKAMVEGSAGAAKLLFLLNPSSPLKPADLQNADNGSVLAGREGDVTVVQANKHADFQTMLTLITMLTERISQAFLILQVRDSERTTAEEVRQTQQELQEQLGGIFGTLTTELQVPYLKRKIADLVKKPGIPKLPKELVFPAVVAGLNGIGRGQDRQALMEFMATLAETLGPQAIPQFINTSELVSRLAASAGIDQLHLVKTEEEIQAEQQAAIEQQQQDTLLKQAGSLAKSPIAEAMGNGGATYEQT
jgi:hypothetical protein